MSPAANMIAHIGSSDRQARVRRASAFQRVLCRSPRSWASMSGGLGDGDGEAERFELADVAAGSAVLVGAVVVVLARAEVLVVGGWVGERFHMITRMVRATATRALRLPRRLTMRRQVRRGGWRCGRCGSGFPQDAFQVGVPLPVSAERQLVPHWMMRGESLAQAARCPAVENLSMSRPISAMMAWAPRGRCP
jgi:hypothetical protein